MEFKSLQTTKNFQNRLFGVPKKFKVTYEEEQSAIDEMKKIYGECINLEVELQREIYEIEARYGSSFDKLYDQRAKVLDDFRNKPKSVEGNGDVEYSLNKFWLRTIKCSYPSNLTERDENILSHLIDLRTKFEVNPTISFTLIFKFEPNEFFSNETLIKTYFIQCEPTNIPLLFDGAEIKHCEGTKIDWKVPYGENTDPSFFDFFNPPVLPTDPKDPHHAEISELLEQDYEFGFYLKERVIPKAVFFFTGEIEDCANSETDSEIETLDEEFEDVGSSGTDF